MPIKTIIDGALLAECEMRGGIRFGMHRVAEDLNDRFLHNPDLDLSFANSIYSAKFHKALQAYFQKKDPAYLKKIVSDMPYLNPRFPATIEKIFRPAIKLLSSLEVGLNQLDENELYYSYYYPFPGQVQRSRIKKCVTFLDIIGLRRPGYSNTLIRLTKKIVESIIPNYAVSISEFSKQDLCDYDKRVDPERVFVVPLAASGDLFFVNKDKDQWNIIKEKYGLPDQYFLCVSSTDHRKNLPHVIRSFSKFVLQQNTGDLHLVLTGNCTYGYSILEELGIEKKVREKIILAKSVMNEDLSVVYSNAQCFFFMSLYEGFGLPALEAMQCGIPVVTSNATSLPEVVGDAGIMLSPTDEDALCDAMYKMYSNEAFRNNYAALGLERAKQFSWQRCADEYIEIFKKIVT